MIPSNQVLVPNSASIRLTHTHLLQTRFAPAVHGDQFTNTTSEPSIQPSVRAKAFYFAKRPEHHWPCAKAVRNSNRLGSYFLCCDWVARCGGIGAWLLTEVRCSCVGSYQRRGAGGFAVSPPALGAVYAAASFFCKWSWSDSPISLTHIFSWDYPFSV